MLGEARLQVAQHCRAGQRLSGATDTGVCRATSPGAMQPRDQGRQRGRQPHTQNLACCLRLGCALLGLARRCQQKQARRNATSRWKIRNGYHISGIGASLPLTVLAADCVPSQKRQLLTQGGKTAHSLAPAAACFCTSLYMACGSRLSSSSASEGMPAKGDGAGMPAGGVTPCSASPGAEPALCTAAKRDRSFRVCITITRSYHSGMLLHGSCLHTVHACVHDRKRSGASKCRSRARETGRFTASLGMLSGTQRAVLQRTCCFRASTTSSTAQASAHCTCFRASMA